MSQVKVSTFKGKPVLELPTGSEKYPFRFGLKKAAIILQHVDAIRQFVEDQTPTTGIPTGGRVADDPGYPLHAGQY